MRRSFPIATAVAAFAMLALAGTATAKTPAKTCTTSSPNVIGKTVKGTLTSSNVDPSQARFATCAQRQGSDAENDRTADRGCRVRPRPSTACRP